MVTARLAISECEENREVEVLSPYDARFTRCMMVSRNTNPAISVKHLTHLVRIAIADDHTLLRKGLKALLQLEAGLMVAAEIAEGDDVLARLAANPCDVLLLDQGMMLRSRVDVRELSESVHVIMICEDVDDSGEALNAVRSGARGVVFQRSSVSALTEAVRAVAAGQVWMAPELQARVADSLHEEPRRRLTPRERDIVRQVACGRRNGEIAKALFISEQTVKTHLGRIFRKLDVRDRMALTLYTSRNGC